MADNYEQFSFMLPVVEGMAMNDVQAWHEEMKNEEGLLFEDDDRYDEWYERYGGLDVCMTDEGIWVSSDESGNVDAAIWVAREYLRHFNLDIGVFFSWACTCSKLRVGEFGGGGVVVTREDEFLVNDNQALRDAAEAGVEVYE